MAKIKVTVRSDVPDLGIHPKYGQLVKGAKMEIEEEDFGAGLFERPHPNFLSPHEQKDQARASEEKQRVGDFDPPEETSPSLQASPASKVSKKQEVIGNA